MGFIGKKIAFLTLLIPLALSDVNVLVVMDEENVVAGNAIEGVTNYVERNSIMTLTANKHIKFLNDEDPSQTIDNICGTLDSMIDAGTPPDVVLDFSYGGMSSEVIKSLSLSLGLPTVSTSMGEEGDIDEWMDLSGEQEKYLIRMRGPDDIFQFIVRDLASVTNISNAAILYDDTFVMTHHYKNLLLNLPVRHLINKLVTGDMKMIKEQIQRIQGLDIRHFFILASQENIQNTLNAANQLRMYGEQFAWFAGTKDENAEFDATCCNDMSIVYFKPKTPASGGYQQLSNKYGVAMTPHIEAAFYTDLILKTLDGVNNMKNDGSWPQLSYSKCADYTSNEPTERSLDLLSAIEASSSPDLWGSMMFKSNGHSYMDFKLEVHLYKAMDGSLMESDEVGTWMAGVPAEMSFNSGMEDKVKLFNAKKVYRIVTVQQPPFMRWNETTQSYEGYCHELIEEIAKILNIEYELYDVADYGSPDEFGNWDGLVGELVNRRADMGVGAIAVMAEREHVIDYTVPYYDLVGITIMMKKVKVPTSLFKFLTVLEDSVWGCILGAYFVTSVLLWVFDRWSPYSYQNNMEKYEDDDEKRYFNLKEALWFCMTSLTPQGGGEAPKNLSGRLVAATWWLFGFIIIASYTANLAAFLTVSRLETPVASLDDLNKQYRIQFAPINGSMSAKYFERMSYIEERFYEVWKDMSLDNTISEYERSKLAVWDYPVSDRYTKIWSNMKDAGLPMTMDEALVRVRASESQNSGFALIADATDVKYLAMTNCDLQMVGDEFSRKPYALAVQQGSPLKDQLNDAILRLLNQRKLEGMKERWWNQNPYRQNCDEDEEDTGGISIHNIGGVFIVIFVGIFLALITLAIEYWYYKNKTPTRVGSATDPVKVKEYDNGKKNKW